MPGRKPYTDRNNQLISLRNSNPKKYSYRKLAKIFKVDVARAWRIYNKKSN